MSPARRSPVRPSLVGALLAVVALAVHARALDAPFVWDDRLLILRSPLVLQAHPLWDYFRAPFWNERFDADGVRAFFRPIVTLSYRLDYVVGGGTPFAFHLTNVLLHAAVTVLVFAWMRRLGAEVLAAAAATVLWALHPRLTESVTWISGRTDVLAALFMFAAMLVWPGEGDPRAGRALRAWGAAALLLIALLAKEIAVVGGIAIVLGEVLRNGDMRSAVKRLLPLGFALAVYGWLRWNALHESPVDDSVPHGWPWYAPLAALGTYAAMIVDPRPSAQIGDVLHPSVVAAVGGAAMVVLAALAVTRSVRASARVWIGPSCLAILGIALVLHVLPLPVTVIAADRYLYVPLAGIAAAAALGMTRAPERARKALLVASAAATVLLGVMCAARIDDWRDELRFWLVTTRVARRDDPLPLGELANVLYRAGDYAGALPLYRAIAARGEGANALRHASNVAACLARLGRYDESLALRRQLAKLEPDNPRRSFDVGLVQLHALRFGPARADFARALALAPDYEEARAMLGRTDEAEAAWPAVVAAGDGDPIRARWLARLGARLEAQAAYVSLADQPGASPTSVLEAARYALDLGDLDVAEVLVRRATPEGVAPTELLQEQLHEREQTARRIHTATAEIHDLFERYASDAG
jgi:protein O-mannosyl-transferase